MGQLTTSGENIVNDTGIPGTLYQGLSTTTPAADGTNVTEPVGNNYARQSLTMGASAGGIRQNTNSSQFVATGGDWGTCTYSVYYTVLSGGVPMGFDDLDAARNMVDGATLNFAAGAVDFEQT